MTGTELVESFHLTLHALWTKAVGASGYDKKEWGLLDQMIQESLLRAGIRLVVKPSASESSSASSSHPDELTQLPS
jgi:hypothetical protein